jgi:NADH dehydrogenase/NADH:ubiquinone oxidoreductase subunit G
MVRHIAEATRTPLQDEHGNLKSQTWTEALHVIKQRMQGVQGDQIRGIAGKLADAESMIALKV